MNWKKWDENTWINMSNGHLLEIEDGEIGVEVYYNTPESEGCVCFRRFNSISEAVAFIEELIKPKCDCESCLTLDELMK